MAGSTTPPHPNRLSPATRLAIAGTCIAIIGLTLALVPLRHLVSQDLPVCTSQRVERAALAYARDFGIASPQLAGFRQVSDSPDLRRCTATITNAAGASTTMEIDVFRDAGGQTRVGALPPRF